MSVFFISDLHLGHRRILEFSPERGGNTIDEHDDWIVERWNSVVRSKHDLVWVPGDVCFDRAKLPLLARMNGRKRLVRGNHDTFNVHEYTKYFEEIYGLWSQYGFWISHAPIHPAELRGRQNVHGHLHAKVIERERGHPDKRYLNVSVERLAGVPIALDEIRAYFRTQSAQ